MSVVDALTQRSGGKCELCEGTDGLDALAVPPEDGVDGSVLVCGTCAGRIAADDLDGNDWYALQGSIWSAVPAVQVLSWRLLKRLPDEGWAQDLLASGALDEASLRWAQDGGDDAVKVVDSNGTELKDGDSVTLIKDLDVKGANFTAKRGTMVKNIRLGDDPTHVEGRVNKTAIFLKTEFLKKA